ncbi:phosphoglycerate mutase family protein [Kaistia dalseonensis]|uniref:Broad specificity phosphatase PhoE n=1 Tax=Kaistia dalseonensis TaxID=410840 RepID=A0ABU0H580_9HYPH|nr:histidine phosphatase family protein [Kaistia dalseonensis]MCX5494885.1 phosphoglycerate mutase family protein [Kaistia dalseonensis]MDQ0437466.1 broad specificity phosphatase PhoE [Kaistia dalseonensis]
MTVVLYLSHPQVAIDPAIPVPEWGLSPVGRARTEAFGATAIMRRVDRVVTSTETKAIETGALLAGTIGLAIDIRPDLHENDRSATGFLPPDQFEAMANRFFAEPAASIGGWERAIDAQARIHRAVTVALDEAPARELTLFVGHGGVGTLLMSRWGGFAIDRKHDQPAGGGNWFAYDTASSRLISSWQPMEIDPITVLG